MYDRQTESWWPRFTSKHRWLRALTGHRLKLVPARLEVGTTSSKHTAPGGKVLVPNNPGLGFPGRNPYVSATTWRPRAVPEPRGLTQARRGDGAGRRRLTEKPGKIGSRRHSSTLRKKGRLPRAG